MDNQISLLTEEQKGIIEAVGSGKNILVSALAGTGKTSTLLKIAEAYPQRKGLYLAYNKVLQIEARQKFPASVACKTIHSLAYEHTGRHYANQLSNKLNIATVVRYLSIAPLRHKNYYASAELVAASACDMVKNYTYSIDEAVQPFHYSQRFIDRLRDKYSPSLEFDLDRIESPKTFLERFIYESWNHARTLWVAMADPNNMAIPASHDTYLKLYQNKKPMVLGYDYIMLDEAQDANPAILDILSHQGVQRIYVGDENQQIYGYRGTINAMTSIEGEKYCLTQSFRFGPAIAEEANKILQSLNVENLVKGYEKIPSKVGPLDMGAPYTFIARTNAELIKAIVSTKDQKRIHFIGDIEKVISLFESAYFLRNDNLSRVFDPSLKQFPSWDKFVLDANLSKDPEYLGIVSFIQEYGSQVPQTLNLIRSLCSASENDADIVMVTAHKAKGRQWPQVHVHNDFTKNGDREEKNIYYVALTRASHVLFAA